MPTNTLELTREQSSSQSLVVVDQLLKIRQLVGLADVVSFMLHLKQVDGHIFLRLWTRTLFVYQLIVYAL